MVKNRNFTNFQFHNWIKVTLIVHPYLLLQDTSYFIII